VPHLLDESAAAATPSPGDEFRRRPESSSSTGDEGEATMGRLVVTEFVTLDGVMEDPGGGDKTPFGGWAFRFDRGADGDAYKLDELRAADAQLLGRVTYEGFAAAWPAMEGAGEFGEKMNAMPKFVVSSTLRDAAWNNTTVLRGDLVEEVGTLKKQFGGDILVAGSAQLVQSLLAHDLVDDLRLMIYPVVLGAGKRLFSSAVAAEAVSFGLVEVKKTGAVSTVTLRRDR
jgi:dihydrofolate reductase